MTSVFASEKHDEQVSHALIANGRHNGCVLEYGGPGIEGEIDEHGIHDLDDLGLDDAPLGLSVWEGTAAYWQSGNPMDGLEWNAELRGAFRVLTSDEWARVAQCKALWPEEP